MAVRDVELHHEKVYVAVGNNLQDGLETLEWAIRRWSSHPISIVILHANSSMSKDFVTTPFGKLHVSVVNEEKIEALRRCEQEKADRILTKYMAFCGKVKAEIHKIERCDEPIQRVILELIMELHITKLVMAISFMRPSSGRSRSAISGSFYVHRNKPEFCDVCIICGGKLVFSREDSIKEEQLEDEEGKQKHKGSFKGWLGKVLPSGKTPSYPSSSASYPSSLSSSRSFELPESRTQWEKISQEVEGYFKQLLEEKDGNNHHVEENGSSCKKSPMEPDILGPAKNTEEKLEILRNQIQETQRTINMKKDQVKAEAERQAKATWAINLCNSRVEELESHISEEISTRINLNKDIEDIKEQVYEAAADTQESKTRLNSLLEIQAELSNKLQVSSMAKSRTEAQLESAANARTELVREIEELRKRKNILHRRIEFCKEKDAIGVAMASKGDGRVRGECREFSAEEIGSATDGFSEKLRLKGKGKLSNVYKGRISHNSVAIKMLDLDADLSPEIFQTKVSALMNIRHPHIVALVGFCSDPKCLVFEYMQNGCLRDILFSRTKSNTLQWRHRVRIASEIASAIGFLHLAEPSPVAHGGLNPSTVLLDHRLTSKLDTFELEPSSEHQTEMRDLGFLLLHLLCGRNYADLNHEAILKDSVFESLDESAGEWPAEVAAEMVEVAVKCISGNGGEVGLMMKKLSLVKKIAEGSREVERGEFEEEEGGRRVPSILVCPIFKVVMENPHMAADGHSYELEAIEEWLETGHETSPLTDMKLEHKHLVPNHALRSLIEEWKSGCSD